MGRRIRRIIVLLALPPLGCAEPPSPAREAIAALAEARRLDARLDSAVDPAAAAAARESALAEAKRKFARLADAEPESPEAALGRSELAWLADRDLNVATAQIELAIAGLERVPEGERTRTRDSGRTANQLLAEAYAHRASYRISRSTAAGPPLGPPTMPAEPWALAREDVSRALALDPQPRYQLLHSSLARLRPADAPLSPAELTPRAVQP